MTGLFLLPLDNAAALGPINGTAPEPVTNKQFGKALGRALHRPAFMPTPAFALRLLLGEVTAIIATGQRVLPRRAVALGYHFQFPTIDAALADIVQKP
jgi:NAD dependent epimerase/dehydratase family enzyme